MARFNVERSNEECAKIAQSNNKPYNQVEDLQQQIEFLRAKVTSLEQELLGLYRSQYGRDACGQL